MLFSTDSCPPSRILKPFNSAAALRVVKSRGRQRANKGFSLMGATSGKQAQQMGIIGPVAWTRC
jgi:hypothetical protein